MNGHELVALATLTDEEFDGYVAEAIEAIPEPFAHHLAGIPVFVFEEWWHLPHAWPRMSIAWRSHRDGVALVHHEWRRVGPGIGSRMLVCVTELVLSHRGQPYIVPFGHELLAGPGLDGMRPYEAFGSCIGGGTRVPLSIAVYRGSCLRAAPTVAHLRWQLRCLLEYELGHALGLTEPEIAAAHHREV